MSSELQRVTPGDEAFRELGAEIPAGKKAKEDRPMAALWELRLRSERVEGGGTMALQEAEKAAIAIAIA
jgi:hypothetical protein